jgi:hypothetical protein
MGQLSLRRRRYVRPSLAIAAAVAAVCLACNGIVGVRELTFDDADSGDVVTRTSDGGTMIFGPDASVPPTDAGTVDGSDGSTASEGGPPVDGSIDGSMLDGGGGDSGCPVDCLGGACLANVCQPEVTSSFTVIHDLRIDETEMYISADVQGFYRKTKLGTDAPLLVASFGTANVQAWTMSSSGENLYLLTRDTTAGNSSISVVPKSGGILTLLYTVSGGGYLLNLASAGVESSVLFSDDAGMHQVLADGGQLSLATAGLERWALSDGGGHILVPSPTSVFDFPVLNNQLSVGYYRTLAGGSPVTASDDQVIYFAVGATGTIESLPFDFSPTVSATFVATVGANVTGLAADGRALYALAEAPAGMEGYALYRCSNPCTTTPTVLASGFVDPSLLQMDDVALYFVDVSAGTSNVLRLARPAGG